MARGRALFVDDVEWEWWWEGAGRGGRRGVWGEQCDSSLTENYRHILWEKSHQGTFKYYINKTQRMFYQFINIILNMDVHIVRIYTSVFVYLVTNVLYIALFFQLNWGTYR